MGWKPPRGSGPVVARVPAAQASQVRVVGGMLVGPAEAMTRVAAAMPRPCEHEPVPVDLLVTGETVGWLCAVCLADVPAPCRCPEPEVEQVRTMSGAVARRWCGTCGGTPPA